MIVAPDIAFLHFQKTGGTHIEKILARHMPCETRGKHNGLPDDVHRPHVWMGMRNPWDWYVSLWAYGCAPKSGIGNYLKLDRLASMRSIAARHGKRPGEYGELARHLAAAASKDPGFWRDVYADPHDAVRFRRWLLALLGPLSDETGEEYSGTKLHRFAGLMTARYLRVASREGEWARGRHGIASQADVTAWLDRHSVVTRFIHTERLDEEVEAALADLLGPGAVEPTAALGRTNSSTHADRFHYYDDAARALVAQRDAVLIERHGYGFD